MRLFGLPARLRHPVAAVLAVSGIVAGAVATVSLPASAAPDDLTGTVTFDCGVSSFAHYTWAPTITLSALRPDGSTTVTVSGSTSQMAGVSPVPLSNAPFTDELKLTVDGAPLSITGSGTVTALASSPFDVPDMSGTFTSSAASVAVTVTGFDFSVTAAGATLPGVCTVTAGAALGSLTLATGTPPPSATPTVTPTTTASATATPSSSTTAGSGADTGTPAKGKVAFSCALNIGSAFSWKPTVEVSGYRANDGDPVSLVASMSDLPGIAPVPIVGSMNFTLDVKVGGKKTTLKSTGNINAAAKQAVPVTDLTGKVDVSGDQLPVTVSAFSFDFPSGGVGAECHASNVALSQMTVGSEPVDSSASGSGTLPQTGGGDALPVIALWALALTLLGAALLLCVPQAARRKS